MNIAITQRVIEFQNGPYDSIDHGFYEMFSGHTLQPIRWVSENCSRIKHNILSVAGTDWIRTAFPIISIFLLNPDPGCPCNVSRKHRNEPVCAESSLSKYMMFIAPASKVLLPVQSNFSCVKDAESSLLPLPQS